VNRKVRSPWLDDEPKKTVSQREFTAMMEKLRSVPGPTPWHADCLPTMTRSDGSKLVWKITGKEGMIVLAKDEPRGPAYLALGFYCYVWKLAPDTLLVFHERHEKDAYLPAHFHIIECSSCNPIGLEADGWGLERRRTHGDCPVAIKGSQRILELPSDFEPGIHNLHFPEQMREYEEYLLLMTKTGYRLQMCIANPRKNEVEIFPLDWFNDGDFDHGYEWITRIVRDLATGNILGEGIRIYPFIMKPNGEFVDWIQPPCEKK
jgi:hypothetical protein